MTQEAVLHGPDARRQLQVAQLGLLFTPELVTNRDPLEVLEAALPYVDWIQVRPKALGSKDPGEARATYTWSLQVLERVRAQRSGQWLVLVNDRVDVALALASQGIAGVHLGQDDLSLGAARQLLGPQALIGRSTHNAEQVLEAVEEGADYLGFGPIFATSTKGYEQGLGSEPAWVAAEAAGIPLFPIGGIGLDNAGELARIGRAAVSSAILCAADPARAARELRNLLGGSTQGKSSNASP